MRWFDSKHIKSILLLIITSLFVISCTTNGDVFVKGGKTVSFSDVLEMYNGYNGSVYMGVSGKYTSDEKATEKAVENLAKNIALSNELQVRVDTDVRTVTRYNYNRFKQDSVAVYDSTKLQYIVDNMKILKIERADFETGVYAIGIMPSSPVDPVKFPVTYDRNGKPSWVDDEPEIPGYVTAVGKTLEYQYVQDSLEAAAYNGVVSLVSKNSGHVISAESAKSSMSHKGTDMDVSVYEINLNKLKGFRVLAYWFDADSREFYALVAMEEK